MDQRIFDLKLKGYCCSQMIMEMGLQHLNKKNPDLIEAMAGLCDGVYQGKICGVLSAAVCLLYLADPYEASKQNVQNLNEWFEDTFGAIDCGDLMETPIDKIEKCPLIIEATFTKVSEMLEWD